MVIVGFHLCHVHNLRDNGKVENGSTIFTGKVKYIGLQYIVSDPNIFRVQAYSGPLNGTVFDIFFKDVNFVFCHLLKLFHGA